MHVERDKLKVWQVILQRILPPAKPKGSVEEGALDIVHAVAQSTARTYSEAISF